MALGVIVLVSGVLMLASTFFSWFHGAGLFEDSGWEVMRALSGNFLWRAADGKIFFSGSWSRPASSSWCGAGPAGRSRSRLDCSRAEWRE